MPTAADKVAAPPGRGGAKRRRGRPPGSRARKRQKRLDAIRDNPALRPASPQSPQCGGDDEDDDEDDEEPGALRRSSRVRRAPVVLDSSPVPSHRRRKPRRGESPNRIGAGGSRKRKRKRKKKKKKKTTTLSSGNREDAVASAVQGIEASVVESDEWRLRLRSRDKLKGRKWVREWRFRQSKGVLSKGKEAGHRRKGKKVVSTIEVSEDGEESAEGEEAAEETDNLTWNDYEDDGEKTSEEEVSRDDSGLQVVSESDREENSDESNLQVGSEANREPETAEPACEAEDEDVIGNSAEKEELDKPVVEDTSIPAKELENAGPGENAAAQSGENLDSWALESEEALKEGSMRSPVSDDKLAQMDVKEGRRCGLCGGGTDGRPPKILVQEAAESDHEAYEGSLASEEPNYDVWDGFGDEPGWLGRILGPIHDRFGIARVWVHQNCAVWSPESCNVHLRARSDRHMHRKPSICLDRVFPVHARLIDCTSTIKIYLQQ